MRALTPDHLRREVLRLDMHDFSAPEIAQRTGVNRSTVDYIIRRTRGPHESTHRGNVKLLHDPAGNLPIGAQFSTDDLNSMVKFSGLADGTLFEVARRDGSVYRAEIRSGELVRCQ
jgi:hypothetical protein